MGEGTSIEWATSTYNPWIGCTKVSEACRNPRKRTKTHKDVRRWERWCAGGKCGRCGHEHSNVQVGLDGKCFCGCAGFVERPRVFCASLADWLDHEVPAEWLADLLALIAETPHLTWLLLTKRPELWDERLTLARTYLVSKATDKGETDRLCAWAGQWAMGDPPPNVWVGTTVEDQANADKRIPELLKIPARIHFLSCEPLLGPIVLPDTWPGCFHHDYSTDHSECAPTRSWVICGGESGPGARPMHPDWARSLRDQCQEAGVPFFMKQMDMAGGKSRSALKAIPEDLMIREVPSA